MKNLFCTLIIFTIFFSSYASENSLLGSWNVAGKILDKALKKDYSTHANSYFWSDAAVNKSKIEFKEDGTFIYKYMGEVKTAKYKLVNSTLTFYFVNRENKESYTEFDYTQSGTSSFELQHEDPMYKTIIQFTK